MNTDWQNWIQNNLSRHCNPKELFSILQKNGFQREEILRSFIHYGVDMRRVTQKDQIHPFYDIAITKNPMVQQYHDDRIQLFFIDNFLHPVECLWLISAIDQELQPSTVTIKKDSKGFRTSQTSYLNLNPVEGQMRTHIEKRIAMAIGIPLSYSERTQGQKYTVGQEFKAHTDAFAPNSKEFSTFASDFGQRTWTCMIYLNDTPKGGETLFTKLDHAFSPQMGKALFWNNLDADGLPNPWTTHHGMPVIEGEKYIITKWFRENSLGVS